MTVQQRRLKYYSYFDTMTLLNLAHTNEPIVAAVVGGKLKAGFGLAKYSTIRILVDHVYDIEIF